MEKMARKAAPVITPTSPAKTCKASRRALGRAGFTLIEIMVVLAIIAATMTIALPKLFGRKSGEIKSVARQFIVLGKEIRNHARLKNVPLRLVIDMDPSAPKYWIEIASGPQLIDPKADKDKEDEEDEEKPKDWSMYSLLSKEKKALPGGFYFGSVETVNMQAPQTDGVAYVHFFPEGLMEAAAIQITDRDRLTWTLIYNPLTGQADIAETARALKDVNK